MAKKEVSVRVAPNSKESEMMVLGCMLTSINSLNIAADGLEDLDFYYTEHQKVFASLRAAYRADKPADIHLIAEDLKRQNQLEEIGGISYLTTLAQFAGTSAYIEEYVSLVKEKAILRRMIHAAQTIEKDAFSEPDDVSEALDDAQARFFQISQSTQGDYGATLRDLISGAKAESGLPYLKELQERQQRFQERGPNDPTTTGVPTHFIDLDKTLNGFGNSNLIILASRPAMGKTALALGICESICFKNQMPVGIFSLEMSAEQLLHRLICSRAEVDSEKIQTGSLNGAEYQRIVSAAHAMQKHTMVIDDQPGLKITDLRARARRMKETHKIGFLMIDYLQLITGSGTMRSMENRQVEISEISRMLKTLARELNIPVLCLAQLSRRVEERQGHRPMMSDLRESGCLTGDTEIQDAETGQIYTIRELAERPVQNPIKVFAVDSQLKLKPHSLIKAFYSGRKVVYKMTTKSGRFIKASANHPFLKLNGWTRLDQLKIGDRIGLPRHLSSSQNVSKLKQDELILLGHLLGDGCILPKQPYHYTSADPINIKTVSTTAARLFGIKPNAIVQKNWVHLYLPSPTPCTHGKYNPITNWFNDLKIKRVRSYEKKIPEAVFCSNFEDRTLFLRHLWATDGNISEKKLKGRKPAAAIYYASSSHSLARQTQHLLLTLGIHSTIRLSHSKKGYRTMAHVAIEGAHNQLLFLSKVGCTGKRGEQIPSLIENLSKIRQNPNLDVIPQEAWSLFVKEAKKKANLSWRDLSKKLNCSYSGSSLLKSGISRERILRLHSILDSDVLLKLGTSDVYWDEITSIETLGEEDVYDATVDEVHNFVANGFIVHNSIEQDSDVVLFLLRREYYDPYDKPGVAEVIVAKNRHGPVGNIQLTYRKELAQFANYTPLPGQEAEKASAKAFSPFNP